MVLEVNLSWLTLGILVGVLEASLFIYAKNEGGPMNYSVLLLFLLCCFEENFDFKSFLMSVYSDYIFFRRSG